MMPKWRERRHQKERRRPLRTWTSQRTLAGTICLTLYLSILRSGAGVAGDDAGVAIGGAGNAFGGAGLAIGGAGTAVRGAGKAVSGAGKAVRGAAALRENSTDLANEKLIRIPYANVSFSFSIFYPTSTT